jgi:hypothetical protein
MKMTKEELMSVENLTWINNFISEHYTKDKMKENKISNEDYITLSNNIRMMDYFYYNYGMKYVSNHHYNILKSIYYNLDGNKPKKDVDFDEFNRPVAQAIQYSKIDHKIIKVPEDLNPMAIRSSMMVAARHSNGDEVQMSYKDWLNNCTNRLREYYQIDPDSDYELDFDVYVFPKYDGITCIVEVDDKCEVKRIITNDFYINGCLVDITDMIGDVNALAYSDHNPYQFGNDSGRGIQPNSYNKVVITLSNVSVSIMNEILNDTVTHTARELIARSIIDYYKTGEKSLSSFKLIQEEFAFYDDTVTNIGNGPLFDKYFRLPVTDENDIMSALDAFKADALSYNCNGIVISVVDPKIRNALGFNESGYPRYEISIDEEPQSYEVTVDDVKFNMSISKTLMPVLKVRGLKINGIKNCKEIPLYKPSMLKAFHIAKHDQLLVYADTIPLIYKNLTYDKMDKEEIMRHKYIEIRPTTYCPICGKEFDAGIKAVTGESDLISDDDYKCENPDCISNKINRMNMFLKKLDVFIPYEQFVSDMYYHQIASSIPGLFKIYDKDIQKRALNRLNISEYTLKRYVKSLKAQTTDVAAHRVLTALSIPALGEKRCEIIVDCFGGFSGLAEALKTQKSSQLPKKFYYQEMYGIGPKKVASRLLKHKKEIIELSKYVDTYLTGTLFIYAFTKVHNPELDKYLFDLGGLRTNGRMKLSVEDKRYFKDDKFLITPPYPYTNGYKETMAIENGWYIIPENTAKEYFKERFDKI